MSAQDMRDMMGLTNADRQPPTKKRKVEQKKPAEKGMAREVSMLMGERAPLVSMIQMQPKYKQKPRRSLKAAPWEMAAFTNSARQDDLVLHHWARKRPNVLKNTTAAEGDQQDNGKVHAAPEAKSKAEYRFAKYNVQVDTPVYSEELYGAELNDDDDWTKEETDYLVDLVKDYSQKWPIIIDRYEYKPTGEGSEAKDRTMEDLKSRYYAVSAKVLAHEIPVESMNRQQFSLYESMRDFDGEKEATRKRLAEQHLHKTEKEVQEETALLAELQRIMISQQKLEAERKELRDRLDYPHAKAVPDMSTVGLSKVFQELLAADRLKKDRRLREHPGTATTAQSASAGHRDSIAGASAVSQKAARSAMRESIGSVSAVQDLKTARPLSPRSSARYYVTTHDKISSGVSFASDKLSKSRIAKSAVQTERIAAVLQYLKLPDVIPLPTQAVVEAFEGVMAKVHELLEMRKLAEKEEQEIKVRAAERDMRRAKEAASSSTTTTTTKATNAGSGDKAVETTKQNSDMTREASVDKKDENGSGDAASAEKDKKGQKQPDEPQAATVTASGGSRRQKRSASVLSATSQSGNAGGESGSGGGSSASASNKRTRK